MLRLDAFRMHRLSRLLQRLEAQLEREGGEPAAVRESLEDVARRMGVHLEAVRLVDAASLVELLEAGGSGRLWAAAEVLFLDGLLARAEGRPQEARHSLEKARLLYGRVDAGLELPDGRPPPAERLRRIDRLANEEAAASPPDPD